MYIVYSISIISAGYQSLVGSTKHSWGWDLGRNKALHNGQQVTYPVHATASPAAASTINGNGGGNSMEKLFTVPDTFYMILDLEAGHLAFLVDNQFLGIAHKGNFVYWLIA